MTMYYVDASRPDNTGDGLTLGTAKKTVAAGVALALASGDIVEVAAGTYPAVGDVELLVAGVILRGPNAAVNPVTDLGLRTAEAILQAGTIRPQTSDCQVLGFEFDGGGPGGACVTTSGVITAENVVIRNNIMSGNMMWGVLTVATGTFSNWLIEANVVVHGTNGREAIWINSADGATGNIIRGNRIDGGAAINSRGINCGGGDNYNMLVEDNIINTSYWGVLAINGNDGLTIRRNTIYGTASSKATYWGITIAGSSTGLQTKNIVVEDNIIYDAGYGPISVNNYGGNVGDVAIRNNTITVQAESGWNISGINVSENSGSGQPLPSNIVVTGNSVNVVGSYTGVATSVYGISVGGNSIKTMVVTNNVLNYGAAASVEALYPKPSAVIILTNSAPYTGILTGDTTISGNTITGDWSNAVVLFDDVAVAYGNIQAPATVTVRDSFQSTFEYGVRSGAGENVDARDCKWGDFSGPSGGVVDPVTGSIADGAGCKVSEYVLFDPYQSIPYNSNNADKIEGLTEDTVFGIGRNANKFSDGGIPSIVRNNTAGRNRGPLVIIHSTGGVTPNRAHLGIGGGSAGTSIGYKYQK